jgi:hypothetical protein
VGDLKTMIKTAKKARKKANKKKKAALKGKGDYSLDVQQISDPVKRIESKVDHVEKMLNKMSPSANLGGKIGRSLGNFIGQGDLGAMAGEGLAKLFGKGDYSVKVNSLMHAMNPSGPQPPKFSTEKRSVRIVEREFVMDVTSGTLSGGSSVFTNTSFALNPSNRSLFPWLAEISELFEQWRPNGIVLEFVSTSSEFNGTSQALGVVVMATDYDSSDATYTTKSQMENSDYACSTKPSNSLMHGIECDPSERPTEVLYTSTKSVPQLSDLGNFQLATVGCSTAGAKLGELWITYDVEFFKKQLSTQSTLYILEIVGITAAVGFGLLGDWPAANLGSAKTQTGNFTGSGSTVFFPPEVGSGTFIIAYNMVSGTVTENYSLISLVNCTTTTVRKSNEAATSNTFWQFIKITGNGASFSMNAKATSNGTVSWVLAEMSSNIV